MGRKKKIVEETKDYNEEDYSCEKECFKIFSGTYIATFYHKDKNEVAYLEKYREKQKAEIISIIVGICFLVLIAVCIFAFLIVKEYFLQFFLVAIACFIASIISFSIYGGAKYDRQSIMFDYILHDLNRNGIKVSYSNKTTGTISYTKEGNKVQLSVYKGYNSHTNSQYWKWNIFILERTNRSFLIFN